MRNAVPLLCMMAMGASLLAQTRFTTGTAAVRVDALVTDGNRPLMGLTAKDFELRDNGVAQRISDVSHETLPLNIICVFDLSGSVEGMPLVRLKSGYMALVDALTGTDRAALVTFTERLQIHTTLTGDRTRLRSLVDEVKAGGATAFFDAVLAGLALRESDGGRTLVLLFSDGRDTVSWLTARKVIDAARRSDVVVYPVTVRSTNVRMFDPSGRSGFVGFSDNADPVLDALADDTGGRLFYADTEVDLAKTFVEVLSEFRQRYVLSYSPAGVAPDGWHTIDVTLRGRRGQIRARPGYFADPLKRGGAAKTPR
jgi:VWFA-related protein